jgi:hypothetical protein
MGSVLFCIRKAGKLVVSKTYFLSLLSLKLKGGLYLFPKWKTYAETRDNV